MTDAPQDIMENFQWLHPPGAGWDWGAWAFLLPWLIFLGALGGYLSRRKKLGLAFFNRPPPHETALRALNELRQKISEESQLEFIVEVSQVVRLYIQDRFGLRAPHRSTEEFLQEVHEGDRLLRDHHELLGHFLVDCDLVKFAQRRVLLGQMEQMLDGARRFVETTVPPRQPEPVNGKSV